ncbi:protein-tyrosine phosphatase-like protein [Paraphysoderma sedebokerense]|nr:protein-tyrosine phosphatase-like protein [Paraphysoderma sedebokerense]
MSHLNVYTCAFCNGRQCKYENYKLHPNSNAIPGLFSNFVDSSILATQRPSSRIIQEHDLIKQFKNNNICSIINLQEVGEHPRCGDGILKDVGFAYSIVQVFYYNFGWRDMSVPSMDLMMNLVKVISHTLEMGRKTSIHCHAGLGRTGLAIACYLVYSKYITATEAVQIVREQRPGAVQTAKQASFVNTFESRLNELRNAISPTISPNRKADRMSLRAVLELQREYLHGEEQRILRNVPKILYVVVERFRDLLSSFEMPNDIEAEHFDELNLNNVKTTAEAIREAIITWNGSSHTLNEQEISLLQVEIGSRQWAVVKSHHNIHLLVHILFSWLMSLEVPTEK